VIYADGASYRQIAEMLNQEGIYGIDGRRWHTSTVRYVIRNPRNDQESVGKCWRVVRAPLALLSRSKRGCFC
jgi:hypothetical protein